MSSLLEVRGITRRFGNVRAVDRLSFTVEPGCIHGFIGPNGAGKTTTMRIAATLDLPDDGDALVDGHSVLEEPDRARARLGFMADKFLPYPDMSVAQYLDFFARAYSLSGRERRRTLDGVIGFCDLKDMLDRPATGLSKGMGQRLHLAKTLLHDPPLLILDEPAAGLDPRARIALRELLRELADGGKGILISSHILAELSEICDSVVVIEAGCLVVAGKAKDVARGLREHHVCRLKVLKDAAAAERWLLVQPLVRQVSIVDPQSVLFDFLGDEAKLAELLARMVGEQLPVYALHLEDANLEEVFLRSTAGKLQ